MLNDRQHVAVNAIRHGTELRPLADAVLELDKQLGKLSGHFALNEQLCGERLAAIEQTLRNLRETLPL